MGEQRKQKGITLVALVVTIIVLLILAGVTIMTLFGENGIIKKAEIAKEETNQKTASEQEGINNLSDKMNSVLNGSETGSEQSGGDNTEVKIKLTDGNTVVTLTEANYGQYLGSKVNYIPTNPSADYGTSTTYRLFYIDFAGKYGEKGATYLKADSDGKGIDLRNYKSYASTDSYTVMKSLNPSWVEPETLQTNDKCVSWLLDPNVWVGWEDTTTEGIKDNINYVIGAPSLEMYIDSYNKYLDSHTGLKKNGGTNPAQKLVCEYVTSGYNAKGYRIGFEGEESESWANSGYWQNANSLISSSKANGMYNQGEHKDYYLSSSSAGVSTSIMFVGGYNSNLVR